MNETDRRLALLKVLAAAAWADGRVDDEEVDHILSVARSSGLGEGDLQEVRDLLATPVPLTRCEELIRELLDRLNTDEERLEVLHEVERLFRADGDLAPSEDQLLGDLRGVLSSQSAVEGFLGRITDVFRGVFSGGKVTSGTVSVFLENLVLQRLEESSGGAWREHMEAEALNRACLHGAVLGKVADTEDGHSEEELACIRERIGSRSGAEPPLLDWIMEAVGDVGRSDLDRQKLLSEFNRISTLDQRIELLDDAFSVAGADGVLGKGELGELRLMSNFLWIDPRDYNAVRVRCQNRLTKTT